MKLNRWTRLIGIGVAGLLMGGCGGQPPPASTGGEGGGKKKRKKRQAKGELPMPQMPEED